MNFEEAAELQERMEGLQKLEGQLSSSQPKDVDMDLLNSLLGPQAQEDYEGVMRMESSLEDGGYVVDKGDRFELTPRGVRRIGQIALRDIYKQLSRDAAGRHQIARHGSQEVVPESSKPYVSGDPLNLNLNETLRSALRRDAKLPLKLDPRDFMVFDSQYSTRAATVLLLDMSWSMSWDGRFAAAKKVALAMESLCRSKYPQDYFGIVGFFTRAVELKAKDLPEATWNMGDPFTNLQDGLHLAIDLLKKRSSTRNQQIIVITDGQPTAYCRQGRLYCEWPLSFGGISQRAAEETLKEAKKGHPAGHHHQHVHAGRQSGVEGVRGRDDPAQQGARFLHPSRSSGTIPARGLPAGPAAQGLTHQWCGTAITAKVAGHSG